jgi:hypothetical protein
MKMYEEFKYGAHFTLTAIFSQIFPIFWQNFQVQYISTIQNYKELKTYFISINSTTHFTFTEIIITWMINNTQITEITTVYNSSTDAVWCWIKHQILQC